MKHIDNGEFVFIDSKKFVEVEKLKRMSEKYPNLKNFFQMEMIDLMDENK